MAQSKRNNDPASTVFPDQQPYLVTCANLPIEGAVILRSKECFRSKIQGPVNSRGATGLARDVKRVEQIRSSGIELHGCRRLDVVQVMIEWHRRQIGRIACHEHGIERAKRFDNVPQRNRKPRSSYCFQQRSDSMSTFYLNPHGYVFFPSFRVASSRSISKGIYFCTNLPA